MANPASSINIGPQPARTFWSECKYVWRSTRDPFNTPIKFNAYLVNAESAGQIGLDKRMQYGNRFRTVGNQPIILQNDDFHATLALQPDQLSLIWRIAQWILQKIFFYLQSKNSVEPPAALPATILQNSKENDRLLFRWEGRLFEYTLRQQLHPQTKIDFERLFKNVQLYMQQNWFKYLFEEDSLPVIQMPTSELSRFYSEHARIYIPATKSLSPTMVEKDGQLVPTPDYLAYRKTQMQVKKIGYRFRNYDLLQLSHRKGERQMIIDCTGGSIQGVIIAVDLNFIRIVWNNNIENVPATYMSEREFPEDEQIDPTSFITLFQDGVLYVDFTVVSKSKNGAGACQ
jgi:hypothetical protein